MIGGAEERLRSVLADVGTRLDKIVGPFQAMAGDTQAIAACPWCDSNRPPMSFTLEFHDGRDGPHSGCSLCDVKGDVLFTADDNDGRGGYAIVRRWAHDEDEVDQIVSLGI